MAVYPHFRVLAYHGGLANAQFVDHMFSNSFYAGVIRDPWSGEEYTGRHVAMVTATEFARVQQIVHGRSKSQPHHRITDDFPLRGQVRCPSCDALMTGYFAQGKRKSYPYYKCWKHGCPTRSKSYAARLVHEEFSEFLAETSIPHYLAANFMTELVTAYWDESKEIRKGMAIRKSESERLRRQLQELISMRTERLVADDEFTTQREHLRRRLYKIEAGLNQGDASLTETEMGSLARVVSSLDSAWRTIPREARLGFGRLLLPAGYVFRRVRTAEKGLLFRTLGPSQADASHLGGFTKETLNTLFLEIRRLLALIGCSKEPENEAA